MNLSKNTIPIESSRIINQLVLTMKLYTGLKNQKGHN